MNKNYRDEAMLFFNGETNEQHKSWADAAAAYFSSLSGVNKRNYVEALNVYYAALNSGSLQKPVYLSTDQAVTSNGSSIKVTNSTGAQEFYATVGITDGVLKQSVLSSNSTLVKTGDTFTIPVSFSAAHQAGSTDTTTASIIVSGGVVTEINIT